MSKLAVLSTAEGEDPTILGQTDCVLLSACYKMNFGLKKNLGPYSKMEHYLYSKLFGSVNFVLAWGTFGHPCPLDLIGLCYFYPRHTQPPNGTPKSCVDLRMRYV